jgi:rhamnosyltransferase
MNISDCNNTAGVVVLYNPDNEVWDNIQSYLQDIAVLYVIDNSELKNSSLVNILLDCDKIRYIDNEGNAGLASALNLGATYAIENNYKWLLTMDQDSRASWQMLLLMRDFIASPQCPNSIGIVAPFHQDKHSKPSPDAKAAEEAVAVMTSGNLLNLQVYKETGPFETKFFIDYIDIEYCLRLKSKGYSIHVVNQAILQHNLGNITKHTILRQQIGTSNHSYLRRYYITRNSLFVAEKYRKQFPAFCKSIQTHFWKELLRVLLFEDKKLMKFIHIYKGYKDFKKNTFYKFNTDSANEGSGIHSYSKL